MSEDSIFWRNTAAKVGALTRDYMSACGTQDGEKIEAKGAALVEVLTHKEPKGNNLAVELYEHEGAFDQPYIPMTHAELFEYLVRATVCQNGKQECAIAANKVVGAIVDKYPSEESKVDMFRSHQKHLDAIKFGAGPTNPRERSDRNAVETSKNSGPN